jgi:hypothetical protein
MTDLEAVLDATVLRPGDTLVLRVAADVSREWFEDFKAHLAGRLPGVETVVVAGVEQMLVYRPGTDD